MAFKPYCEQCGSWHRADEPHSPLRDMGHKWTGTGNKKYPREEDDEENEEGA